MDECSIQSTSGGIMDNNIYKALKRTKSTECYNSKSTNCEEVL